jgi:hypothetical protein
LASLNTVAMTSTPPETEEKQVFLIIFNFKGICDGGPGLYLLKSVGNDRSD